MGPLARKLAALVIFLAHCLPGARALAADLVFDLDWTLFYQPVAEMQVYEPGELIRVGEQTYRPTDLAVEALARLHENPGLRISFFSGGDAERNQALVDELYRRIRVRFGKDFHPYRVLSRPDLTAQAGAGKAAPFTTRFKKDLEKAGFDLGDTVIVDDIRDFVPASQDRNLLFLGKTFDDIESFETWKRMKPRPKLRFPPGSAREFAMERNKLAWVTEIVTDALRKDPDHWVDRVYTLSRERWKRPHQTARGLERLGVPADPYRRVSCARKIGHALVSAIEQ